MLRASRAKFLVSNSQKIAKDFLAKNPAPVAKNPPDLIEEYSAEDTSQVVVKVDERNLNDELFVQMKELYEIILASVSSSKTDVVRPISNWKMLQSCGHLNQMQKLIEEGADLNLKLSVGSGFAPIHFAAMLGNVGTLQFLLKDPRLDIGIVDNVGQTALQIAVGNGFTLSTLMILRAINDSDKDKIFPRIFHKNTNNLMALNYCAGDPGSIIYKALSNYVSNKKDSTGWFEKFKDTTSNGRGERDEVSFSIQNFCCCLVARTREIMMDSLRNEVYDNLIKAASGDLLQLATTSAIATDISNRLKYEKNVMIQFAGLPVEDSYFPEILQNLALRKEELSKKALPEKTPAERLQQLKRLMCDLQKDAASSSKNRNFEVDCSRMFEFFKKSGADVNITTTDNWTMLHIAAKSGCDQITKALIAENAAVNLRSNDGISVLRCAIASGNADVMKRVLSVENIDPIEVMGDLKEGIKSKNKRLVATALGEENFIKKFAALEKEIRENLLRDLRESNNQRHDLATNIEELRKNINKFAAAVNFLNLSQIATKNDEDVAPQRISKKERERVRKEQKKIEKSELERQQKSKEEERRKIAQEKTAMSDEDFNILALRQENVEQRNSKVAADAPKVDTLSQSEGRQVRSFLQEKRKIQSLDDLPEFLQKKFRNLLDEKHAVLLKGSVVYGLELARSSQDIDIEVCVKAIRNWPDLEVVNFVRKNFDVEIDSSHIYRGRNRDGSSFAVNIKDETRALDISIYDREKLPDMKLDWVVSKERKIFFEENGMAKNIISLGLFRYLERMQNRGLKLNAETDFFINSQSRGLMMRLCFLQTIGYVNAEEIKQALPSILPNNPIDLIFRELKLDCVESKSNQDLWIRNKLSVFMKSHNFSEKEQAGFLQNFAAVMAISHNEVDSQPRRLPQYSVLFATVDKMMEEKNMLPSSLVNHVSMQQFHIKEHGRNS